MNFETFLEDFSWFDKSHKAGTHYLNPIKRDASWLKPDTYSSNDVMEHGEALEDAGKQLGKLVGYYKVEYTQFPELIEFVKTLKVSKDYIVYRTFGGNVHVKDLKIGSVINHHNALLPTSLEYDISLDFTGTNNAWKDENGKKHVWVTRVQLKKGSKAFIIDAIRDTAYSHEKEILMVAKPFKVTGFSYVETPQKIVHTVDCSL